MSLTDSFAPKRMSSARSTSGCAPSSAAATTNAARVRVDGLRKTIAMLRPASRSGRSPRRFWSRASAARSSSNSTSSGVCERIDTRLRPVRSAGMRRAILLAAQTSLAGGTVSAVRPLRALAALLFIGALGAAPAYADVWSAPQRLTDTGDASLPFVGLAPDSGAIVAWVRVTHEFPPAPIGGDGYVTRSGPADPFTGPRVIGGQDMHG